MTWPFGAVGALAGWWHGRCLHDLATVHTGQRDLRPTTGGAPSRRETTCRRPRPCGSTFGAMLVYPENGSGWVFCSDRGHRSMSAAAGCCLASIRWFDDQPEESWEGSGSLVCGMPAAIIHRLSWSASIGGLLLGVLTSCSPPRWATWWSQVKRDLGIKEHRPPLLPGHAVPDRLGGMRLPAVAAWIVLTLLP